MRLHEGIALALFCKSTGLPIWEVRERIESFDITLQDIISQVTVEIACNPLSAEALANMVYPGLEAMKRKRARDEENSKTWEFLKAFKKEQQQAEVQAEKPKPKPKKTTTVKVRKYE